MLEQLKGYWDQTVDYVTDHKLIVGGAAVAIIVILAILL